jgi:hypothetical protein
VVLEHWLFYRGPDPGLVSTRPVDSCRELALGAEAKPVVLHAVVLDLRVVLVGADLEREVIAQVATPRILQPRQDGVGRADHADVDVLRVRARSRCAARERARPSACGIAEQGDAGPYALGESGQLDLGKVLQGDRFFVPVGRYLVSFVSCLERQRWNRFDATARATPQRSCASCAYRAARLRQRPHCLVRPGLARQPGALQQGLSALSLVRRAHDRHPQCAEIATRATAELGSLR